MHHALRFYGRYREFFLRYYIFQARWTRVPVLGRAVRAAAQAYGKTSHTAYVLTLEEACRVVDASPTVMLGPCWCRKVFKKCDGPARAEIVVGPGTEAFHDVRRGDHTEISKQEARDILQACHDKHLVHTMVRCRGDFYAICNCCSCCCVPLRLRRDYRIGNALGKGSDIMAAFASERWASLRPPTGRGDPPGRPYDHPT